MEVQKQIMPKRHSWQKKKTTCRQAFSKSFIRKVALDAGLSSISEKARAEIALTLEQYLRIIVHQTLTRQKAIKPRGKTITHKALTSY